MNLRDSIFGRTDSPTESDSQDKLASQRNAAGLAEFVRRCQTPMTIAIQGEWGAGKTSVMKMVRTELQKPSADSRPLLCWFDTWQYGAVGDDDALGMQLLMDLVAAIGKELSSVDALRVQSRLMGMASTIGRRSREMMKLAGSAVAAGAVSYLTGGIVDGGTLVGNGDGRDERAIGLHDLKQGFQKLVEMCCNEGKHSRVVVFIDDLDRVRPGRAVAMLEVLKNFLDVESTVFVIACDYEVVQEGVKERLGVTDPDKVRAFFDKVFQVHFDLPVETYEAKGFLEEYVLNLVMEHGARRGIGDDVKAPFAARVADDVKDVVAYSVGTNPRAVKRYLNLADLLRCIRYTDTSKVPWADLRKDQIIMAQRNTSLYLAMIAMYNTWPEVAAYLASLQDFPAFLAAYRVIVSPGEGVQGAYDEELQGTLQAKYGEGSTNWQDSSAMRDMAAYFKALVRVLRIGAAQPTAPLHSGDFDTLAAALQSLPRAGRRLPTVSSSASQYFRSTALNADLVAGDAFAGTRNFLFETLKDRQPDVVLEQTPTTFSVKVRHTLGGAVLVPITMSIQSDGPDTTQRLVLKVGVGVRVPVVGPALRARAKDYVEVTSTELGANWIDKNQQAYELVFAADNRVPEGHMNAFRAATLEYCEARIDLVQQAKQDVEAKRMAQAMLAQRELDMEVTLADADARPLAVVLDAADAQPDTDVDEVGARSSTATDTSDDATVTASGPNDEDAPCP